MYNISDSHTDFLVEIKNKNERTNYIDFLKTTPLKLLSCAVFTTNDNLSIKDINAFKNEIMTYNSNIKFLLSIEDISFLNDDKQLYELINLKPISCSLTWNHNNQFSGGTYGDYGLTSLGVKTVKILEKNNILIDTAHLNKKAFWDICKITTKPIYNSHSNLYTFKRHRRNLTDKQIKKIVDSNGYLGLTIYKQFISNKDIYSNDIAKQFDYLIKNFGYKNFGWGTDLYGIANEDMPKDIFTYNDLNKVANLLLDMGHSKEVVEHIMFKNYYDFLKRNNIING